MSEILKFNMRTILANEGATYLRSEDVISFIREIAATEETSTAYRLNVAADNIERIAPKKD